MQATQPLPPPPLPPPVPTLGQAAPQAPGAAPVLTPEAIASLRARRTELSNQLQSAEGRRNRL